MKICTECQTLFEQDVMFTKCPKRNCGGEIVNIDEDFVPICQELWNKCYTTVACCTGHFYDYSLPYIGIRFHTSQTDRISYTPNGDMGDNLQEITYTSRYKDTEHLPQPVIVRRSPNNKLEGLDNIPYAWIEFFKAVCSFLDGANIFECGVDHAVIRAKHFTLMDGTDGIFVTVFLYWKSTEYPEVDLVNEALSDFQVHLNHKRDIIDRAISIVRKLPKLTRI